MRHWYLKYRPIPQSWANVRCTAHGPSFMRVWYLQNVLQAKSLPAYNYHPEVQVYSWNIVFVWKYIIDAFAVKNIEEIDVERNSSDSETSSYSPEQPSVIHEPEEPQYIYISSGEESIAEKEDIHQQQGNHRLWGAHGHLIETVYAIYCILHSLKFLLWKIFCHLLS